MAANCAASSSWRSAKPTVRNSAKISNPSKVQPRFEATSTFHWSQLSERYHGRRRADSWIDIDAPSPVHPRPSHAREAIGPVGAAVCRIISDAATIPPAAGLAAVEGWHDLAGKPLQLLDELARRQPFGPVDHEILEAGIFRLDRFDAVDDLCRRAAEPRLLLHPLAQGRHRRGRAGRPPGTALLVGVAHKAERREPFVALVMRRLEAADRLFLGVGEIDAGAPDHVLTELCRPIVAMTRVMKCAHDVVENFLAVQCHHRLEAVLRHHVDRAAAGDRHPYLDRQMLRPRHAGDVLEIVAAIRHPWRAFVILALVMELLLVEALQQEL